MEDQQAKWKEHFQEVLNRPALEQRPQLNSSDGSATLYGKSLKIDRRLNGTRKKRKGKTSKADLEKKSKLLAAELWLNIGRSQNQR